MLTRIKLTRIKALATFFQHPKTKRTILISLFLIGFTVGLLKINLTNKNLVLNNPVNLPINLNARASASDYTLTQISTFLADGGRVDWSTDGVWIAYDYKEADGYWDVYRIHPEGSAKECLTCERPDLPNKNQGNPDFHPSGRYLLFQAEKKKHNFAGFGNTNPGSGVYNDLWVLDFDTNETYQLTDVRSKYPAGGSLHGHFSPDGTKLLWGDLESSTSCYGNWQLAVADFVTSPTPHLENITYYQPGDNTNWYESQDWSLDNSTIYFSCAPLAGQDDRSMEFCSLNLNSQGFTRLTTSSGLDGEAFEWDEHGKLSPLGDAIVWMSSSGHEVNTQDCNYYDWLRTDLWMMNPDGSGKRKLTHFNDPGYPEYNSGGVIVADHAWSPDTTKLLALLYYNATQTTELKMLHFSHSGLLTSTPTPTSGPTPTVTPSPTPTPLPLDTGWLNPSANIADTGGDGDGFEVNSTDAYTDGVGFAENINGAGDRHRYLNYGIDLPLGAIVQGIEVRLDWWLDKTQGNSSMSVELSWDGGVSWTAAKIDAQETTSEHTAILGGSSDSWGRSWTLGELTNTNFQVRITANCIPSGPCGQRDFFLDWLPVKVYYSQ